MSSKLLPFTLGLLVGAGAAGALLTTRSHPPEIVRERDQLRDGMATASKQVEELSEQLAKEKERAQRQEADNLKLATRVQELMKQSSVATAPVAKKPAAANPLAAMFGDENSEQGKAMRDLMKAAMEQQMEGKLANMKAKLNLTPEQEASIRAILEKQFSAGQAMAAKTLSGGLSKDELTDATRSLKDPETQIKALLSPEQQTAYGSVQQEERQNNARLVANSELLQLQGALGLGQAQQDKVFAVLYQQTEQQLGNAGDPTKTAELLDFRGRMEKKIEALRGVLSDDQLERYRKLQEQQLKMMEAFMPKGGAPDDAVVPNVQILTVPGKP